MLLIEIAKVHKGVVGLRKTAYIVHDTDEGAYKVYDMNDKKRDSFYFRSYVPHERKTAFMEARELKRRLDREQHGKANV